MATISELKKKIMGFWVGEMHRESSQVKIIKISPLSDGWMARVQVTEEDEYLKKLGYPPVFNRNIYDTTLNNKGNVIGFCKEDEREEREEHEKYKKYKREI